MYTAFSPDASYVGVVMNRVNGDRQATASMVGPGFFYIWQI